MLSLYLFLGHTMLPFLAEMFSSLERLLGDKERDFGVAREEADQLLWEVKLIKPVLDRAQREPVGNKKFSEWSGAIERVVYDVEDLVQTHSHESSSSSSFTKKGIAKLFPSDDRKIAKDISLLRQKVHHLNEVGERFGLNDLPESSSESSRRNQIEEEEKERQERSWHSDDDEEDIFFYRKKEIDELVTLVLDDGSVSRIWITGMGGLGKTTLAKNVYADRRIQTHFQARAWVHVGCAAFETGAILGSLLQQLVPDTTEEMLKNFSRLDVCEKIYNTQQSMKCLIVLDDVWTAESWDSLRIAFPSGKTRSKLVITSRINPAYKKNIDIIHEVWFLSQEHIWEAIKRKGYLDHYPDQGMIDKAKDAVKFCGGVPYEVKVLGRMLASMKTEADLNNAIKSLNDNSMSEMAREPRVLSLSFDTLSEPLKHCFLYLGLFPEDSAIDVEKLILLWIAEGLIEPQDNEGAEQTMEDKAEKYLDELAARGLVDVKLERIPNCIRRFASCRVHDVVREFCIRKAQEQSFAKVIDWPHREGNRNESHFLPSDKTRRLAIFAREDGDIFESVSQSETTRYLRSLLCFDGKRHQKGLLQLPKSLNFNCLEMLKVLYFDGFEFPDAKLPNGIEGLVALRCLSFKGCHLEEIPESISQLRNLEILDLRIGPWKMAIPDVLWPLTKMKHLYLPRSYDVHGDDKLRLDTLKYLQTLENFDTRACHFSDLSFLPFLRKITATFEGCLDDLDNILSSTNVIMSFLRQASLDVNASKIDVKDRHDAVSKLFCSAKLHTLHINGRIATLPQTVSSSITVLYLKETGLTEDPMPTLGKFPKLFVLVLGSKAFLGKQMVCVESSFKELRDLKMENLTNLQTLTVVETAMPNLFNLTIEGCQSLPQLPNLHFLKKLREVKFNGRNMRTV